MEIKSFSDKILFNTKKDVLRIHLYIKLIQYGIKPFENDIDIMLELYEFGGYNSSEGQARFINNCIQKKFKKSEQSVRNTLSEYVALKVFDKPRNRTLSLNNKFIPKVDCDILVLQHVISHAE